MSATLEAPPQSANYRQLSARLSTVRRAWKRSAALSGLAVVITESLGILALLLFLDWLFQPPAPLRIGMWIAALGVIGFFVRRHVLTPLSRKISDEQIALYIEEKRSDLNGVLITAAEFGNRPASVEEAQQSALIDAIVREAADRSQKISLSHLADFSRLKKYGVVALAGIAIYALLAVMFPSIGQRLSRVITPWRPTPQVEVNSPFAVLEPIQFELSQTDVKLRRVWRAHWRAR